MEIRDGQDSDTVDELIGERRPPLGRQDLQLRHELDGACVEIVGMHEHDVGLGFGGRWRAG